MSPIGIAVFVLFAGIAGFGYNYGLPLIQPKLPAAFTSSKFALSVTTGVLIIAAVAGAFLVTKAIVKGKAGRSPVRVAV